MPNADGTGWTKNHLRYMDEFDALQDQLLADGVISDPDQLKYYVVTDEKMLATVLDRSVGGLKIFLQHGGDGGYNGVFSTNNYTGLGMRKTPGEWLDYFKTLSPGWTYRNDASVMNSTWHGCDASGGYSPAKIMKAEVEPLIRGYFGG